MINFKKYNLAACISIVGTTVICGIWSFFKKDPVFFITIYSVLMLLTFMWRHFRSKQDKREENKKKETV